MVTQLEYYGNVWYIMVIWLLYYGNATGILV